MTAWIGIDPGMGGALALYLPYSEEVKVKVADTPLLNGELDYWTLGSIVKGWAVAHDVRGVTIERVHSMPRQGVKSMFTFGQANGAVKQAVASAGLTFTIVPPGTWKLIYGLQGGKDFKKHSRLKAATMFPEQAMLFARAKDDGRAEAAMLAHYGSILK